MLCGSISGSGLALVIALVAFSTGGVKSGTGLFWLKSERGLAGGVAGVAYQNSNMVPKITGIIT